MKHTDGKLCQQVALLHAFITYHLNFLQIIIFDIKKGGTFLPDDLAGEFSIIKVGTFSIDKTNMAL